MKVKSQWAETFAGFCLRRVMLASYSFITGVLNMQTLRVPQNTDMCAKIVIQMHNVPEESVALLEFSCPKGIKFVSSTIEIIDQEIEFKIPTALTKYVGEIYVQIIIKRNSDGATIAKSFVNANPTIVIEESINANLAVPQEVMHDIVDDAVSAICDIRQLNSDITEKLQNGELVGGRGERGATGDKGDKGDRGDKGDKGDTGDKGERGETGAQGASADTSQFVTTNTPQTISGTKTISGNMIVDGKTVTPTELGYLYGVTGDLQNQINLKGNAPCGAITATYSTFMELYNAISKYYFTDKNVTPAYLGKIGIADGGDVLGEIIGDSGLGDYVAVYVYPLASWAMGVFGGCYQITAVGVSEVRTKYIGRYWIGDPIYQTEWR